MNFFGKTYTHINRYGEIIGVFNKYGFGDILKALRLKRDFNFLRRKDEVPKDFKNLARWVKFRLALEELGPTFIKLGQLLSNRPDIFPPELISELENLQDNVKPISFDEVKDVIEKELGQTLESIFFTFDQAPLAAASLAQVHKQCCLTAHPLPLKCKGRG